MLKKIITPEIKSNEKKYEISSGIFINAKVIYREELAGKELAGKELAGRKALYLHGGGIYGDHTLAVRPSKWLVKNEIFDLIILPDRIGSGKSSPFTKQMSIKEQSEIISSLLDVLKIDESITVIGSSYGGLISLMLASIDKKINKVILLSSSPTLANPSGLIKVLGHTGLLKIFLKLMLYIYLGRSKPAFIDQDEFYDLNDTVSFTKLAQKVLKHTDRKLLKSMLYKVDSLLDKNNLTIPEDMNLDIPVIQVIGEKDEFWGRDIPEKFKKTLPRLKRSVIKGSSHKDLIQRAEEFHSEAIRLLKEDSIT